MRRWLRYHNEGQLNHGNNANSTTFIQIGEDREGYKEIAEKEKLSELQLRVRQLLDQVNQIQKEQNFQRSREVKFRKTSENTNAKVFWWAAVQVWAIT